jgi:hypothetical protein
VIALAGPYGNDTVAMFLDDRRCGSSILIVGDTFEPDALFDVIDACVGVAAEVDEVDAIVLATIRPLGGLDHDDVHRWLEASDQCRAGGIELVEWFVIGDGVECPRAIFGDAPRWTD